MKKYYHLLLFLILFATCNDDEKSQWLKACFSIENTQINVGDTLSFHNCSENSMNYHWDFGDGQNSTDKEPKHTYNKTGEYKITLLASNDNLIDTFSTNISVLPLPDKIIYQVLNPTVRLNTVNKITSYDFGICTEERPTPIDSATFWDLDINSDNKNDFRFNVKHINWSTINPNQYCGHCIRYLYEIKILATTPGDSVSYYPNGWGPKPYDTTEYVSASDSWRDFDILYLQGGCGIPSIEFQDIYIGVKHQNKLGWIRIAPFGINGIEIKEFALNDTENNPIKAGRKK